MERKTRTILFLIFTLLFFLVSPLIIFYSLGYRLDFENKKIAKTGGLFLKIFPKQTQVYLDNKSIKKTDFIFGSVLIENLLPKNYMVRAEKKGYFPWEKFLEIKEGEVTEAKEVILFPKNPEFEILLTEVKNFWISPDGRKIISQKTEGDGWSLKFYDPERKIEIGLINEKEINQKGATLMNLDFSRDLNEINLEVEIEEKLKIFSILLNETPPFLREKELEKLPFDVIAFQKTESNIYYLDNFGFVFKTDISLREILRLNREAFSIKDGMEYKLIIFGDWVFLKEGNCLYYLNFEFNSFEKLFGEISNLKISPDNKNLVVFSDSEIWVVFLEEKSDQPRKKAGEKIFITRLSEKIEDVFWIGPNYLVFNSGNKIKICEIDDRDKINIYDFGKFEAQKIFWNELNKKLYVLIGEELFTSEKLLP